MKFNFLCIMAFLMLFSSQIFYPSSQETAEHRATRHLPFPPGFNPQERHPNLNRSSIHDSDSEFPSPDSPLLPESEDPSPALSTNNAVSAHGANSTTSTSLYASSAQSFLSPTIPNLKTPQDLKLDKDKQ